MITTLHELTDILSTVDMIQTKSRNHTYNKHSLSERRTARTMVERRERRMSLSNIESSNATPDLGVMRGALKPAWEN